MLDGSAHVAMVFRIEDESLVASWREVRVNESCIAWPEFRDHALANNDYPISP
jgi:hypothetical protein